MSITREEILKGNALTGPSAPQLENNLIDLLRRINGLRQLWGKPMIVTSGYRNAEQNKKVGGAPASKHLTCQALDIADPQGELMQFILNNTDILRLSGLWIESPFDTVGWVHFQSVAPASGFRIFRAGRLKLLS